MEFTVMAPSMVVGKKYRVFMRDSEEVKTFVLLNNERLRFARIENVGDGSKSILDMNRVRKLQELAVKKRMIL